MNRNTGFRSRRASGAGRRALLSLSLLVAGLGAAAPAFADWSVDDDKTQEEIKSLKTEVDNRLDKIYKQHNLYGDTFNVDEHKSITLQYGDGGQNASTDGKLTKFGADDFVTKRCAASATTSSSGNSTSTDGSSSTTTDPTEQSVCKDLVQHQNRLYNYLVDMLELSKNRQAQLKDIIEERKKITDGNGSEYQAGALQSNTNRLIGLQAQLQIDRMNMDLTVSSYQRYFDAKNGQMADIQREKQTGQGMTLTGAGINVARNLALKGALELAKKYSD